MAHSPLYEMMLFAAPKRPKVEAKEKEKPSRATRIQRRNAYFNRYAELTTKSAPSFEEFMELLSLKYGAKHIASKIGITAGTVQQMRQVHKEKIYYQRYLTAMRGTA